MYCNEITVICILIGENTGEIIDSNKILPVSRGQDYKVQIPL
jgi:hypothetical protein